MNWTNQNLGDFCDVIAGQSPEGKYYNDTGVGLPFYQGKKEFGDRFIGPPKKWTTKVTKEAESGDILISVRAPVGPINFATQNICIGRGLAAIRPSEKLNKDFIFYYLLSKQDDIKGNEGAVFASINKSQIEALSFSYVNLEEQKRIVAILDQAFAEIDKALANAEQNLNNARELFESYLQQVFSQRGEGWVEEKLTVVADVIDSLHKTPKYTDDGYSMVRVTDIKAGSLDLANTKKVDLATYEEFSKRYKGKVGDIVFSRVGSYGRSAIVSTNDLFCLGQNTVFLVPSIDSYYFYYYLNSPEAKEQIDKLVAGTTQPTVSLKSIKAILIPIPPENEQLKIVELIHKFLEKSLRLQYLYNKKLESLDELKKSILQKAFTGELTQNNNKGMAG